MKTKSKNKTKNQSENKNEKQKQKQTKMKNKNKNKNENKNKSENENKNKNENENKNEFSFLFSFCFSFLFLLSKSFCIFVNSTWPRGVIGGQLSLDWPRSAIEFLLTPRGLEVPQTVNSLLLGLEVPQHFRLRIFHAAQQCHRW